MAGWMALARAAPAILGAASEEFRKLIPQLEDEVTVEVVGQPGCDKKRLYYLALAAANGIVRRNQEIVTLNPFIPPPLAMLMIEYDAADHWVRCTLRYKTGTLNTAVGAKLFKTIVGGALPGVGGFDLGFDLGFGVGAAARGEGEAAGSVTQPGVFGSAIYTGPECKVTGGDFNFVGNVAQLDTGLPGIGVVGGVPIPGIPESSKSPEAPKLEFEGRTILTPCPTTNDPTPGFGPPLGGVIPSPNPKPPGDNRSRGAVTVPKVQAMTSVQQLATQSLSQVLGNPQSTCCEKSLALVPLVFAALSNPSSYDEMLYARPTQGPTGK